MKRPEDFSSTLTSMRAKRQECLALAAAKDTEYAEIQKRARQAPSPGNERELRVANLLGEKTSAQPVSSDVIRLTNLKSEAGDLYAAAERLDSQIQAELRSASAKLCESVSDEHQKHAQAMIKGMMSFYEADARYNRFIESIHDAGGLTSSYMIMPQSWLGRCSDRHGGYYHFFKEAAEAGFMSHKDIPEPFRC